MYPILIIEIGVIKVGLKNTISIKGHIVEFADNFWYIKHWEQWPRD